MIVVTGAGGQLGQDLLRTCREEGLLVRGLTRADLDVTDSVAVHAALVDASAVINAAAYTAVDAAETDEEAAHLANAVAPAVLAAVCAGQGTPLVHVSTDYVFPGDRADGLPYEPGDPTGPRSAYGRTKLAGELAVRELAPDLGWVVRTAWVYGEHGGNFVKTMARLLTERDQVAVVDDQTGSPTWSLDLARLLVALALRAATGDAGPAKVLHAAGTGEPVTWHGLTVAIAEELDLDPAKVARTTTDAFPRPAPRPAWSVLSASGWRELGLTPLRPWREALRAAFADAATGAALRP